MPKKIQFTNEQVDWLKENYRSVGRKECANILHCSEPSVQRLIRKLGLQKPVHRILTQDEINDIVKLYSVDGWNTEQIARKHHTHMMVIAKVLKENNVYDKRFIPNRFTEEEEKEIVSLYNNKNTMGFIVKKFATSTERVIEVLGKYNIKYSSFNFASVDEDIKNKIINDYNEGFGSTYIAKKYNLPYQTIRNIIIDRCGKLRTKKERYAHKYSKEIIDQIIDLYVNQIKSPCEISKITGLGYTVIRKILNENKIEFRSWYKTKTSKEIRKKPKLQNENLILDKFKETNSINGTAKLFNISFNKVQKILKDNNLYKEHIFYTYNENYFDNIDSHEKAYILGFLITDGCNSPQSRHFSLKLKSNDIHIIEQINRILTKNKPIICRKEKKGEYASLYIHNSKMSNRLVELGLPRAKTFKIKPEDWMMGEFSNSAILGMMDGDGSFYKRVRFQRNAKNPDISWTFSFIGMKCICEMMQKIFKEKLNVNGCLGEIAKYKNNPEKPLCTIRVYGNRQNQILMDWLYKDSPLKLQRKYNNYLELCEHNKKPKMKNQFC